MKNVNVTWTLPTTRESGLPLNPSEIDYVEVSLSADLGTNFVFVDNVLSTAVQEIFLPDQNVGDWVIRLVVVDTAGRRSVEVDTSYNVPDETNPSPVVNVQVTMS